jgi:hypothetical protein
MFLLKQQINSRTTSSTTKDERKESFQPTLGLGIFEHVNDGLDFIFVKFRVPEGKERNSR